MQVTRDMRSCDINMQSSAYADEKELGEKKMDEHIEALRKIQDALSGLEEEKARQVLRWAAEYYGVSAPAGGSPKG